MARRTVDDTISRYFSQMGRKGGKRRFQGVTAADRSEIMKKVRAAGVAKQQAEKARNGSDE